MYKNVLLVFALLFPIHFAASQDAVQAPAAKPAETQTPASDKRVVPASTDRVVDVGTEQPKITPVPGGIYVEWPSMTRVGSIEVNKSVSGEFQIMFDVPLALVGKKPEPITEPQIIISVADYWIVRNMPDKAINLYRIGLQKGSSEYELTFQNNLAMLLSSAQGKHKEALDILNNALESRADNVTLLDSKGLVLMSSGQAGEAVPVLERAVELSCQIPMYCMHLAMALDMDGRDAGARRYFEQARAQLEPQAQNMSNDNKAMFDKLKLRYPNTPAAQE